MADMCMWIGLDIHQIWAMWVGVGICPVLWMCLSVLSILRCPLGCIEDYTLHMTELSVSLVLNSNWRGKKSVSGSEEKNT